MGCKAQNWPRLVVKTPVNYASPLVVKTPGNSHSRPGGENAGDKSDGLRLGVQTLVNAVV